MGYRFERGDARPELRKGFAGTITWWPKVDGLGNVLVSSAAFALYKPGGEVLQASAAVTPTTVDGASRLDLAVDSIGELGEDYFAVVTFTPDATEHGAAEAFERVAQLQFDVVLQPWGDSWVSLSALEGRVPGVRARLLRQVDAYDPDGTLELTVDQLASQWAHRAHAELARRIRTKIAVERAGAASRTFAAGPLMPAEAYTRPRLIVDRLALEPVEVALALSMIFEADIAEGEGQTEAKTLADYWTERTRVLFGELGNLAYDFTEDRVADSTLDTLVRSRVTRRVRAR